MRYDSESVVTTLVVHTQRLKSLLRVQHWENKMRNILILFLAAIMLASCVSALSPVQPTETATATATETRLPTATFIPTGTPIPTATPLPGGVDPEAWAVMPTELQQAIQADGGAGLDLEQGVLRVTVTDVLGNNVQDVSWMEGVNGVWFKVDKALLPMKDGNTFEAPILHKNPALADPDSALYRDALTYMTALHPQLYNGSERNTYEVISAWSTKTATKEMKSHAALVKLIRGFQIPKAGNLFLGRENNADNSHLNELMLFKVSYFDIEGPSGPSVFIIFQDKDGHMHQILVELTAEQITSFPGVQN